MSRKEFKDLKCFSHFADINALDTRDKFTKVRGLHDIINKKLEAICFFPYFYSINKQMIPYTRKNKPAINKQ